MKYLVVLLLNGSGKKRESKQEFTLSEGYPGILCITLATFLSLKLCQIKFFKNINVSWTKHNRLSNIKDGIGVNTFTKIKESRENSQH